MWTWLTGHLFLPRCSIYPDMVNIRIPGFSASHHVHGLGCNTQLLWFVFGHAYGHLQTADAVERVSVMVSVPRGVHISTRESNPMEDLLLPRPVTVVWRRGQLPSRKHPLLQSRETSASPQPLLRKLHLGEARFAFLLPPLWFLPLCFEGKPSLLSTSPLEKWMFFGMNRTCCAKSSIKPPSWKQAKTYLDISVFPPKVAIKQGKLLAHPCPIRSCLQPL